MRLPPAVSVILASLLPFAAKAATAEASLRIRSAAKAPVAEIEENLSILKTDRRLLDEIAARLVLAASWKLDADQTATRLAEKLSISVHQQGATATIQGTDDNPAMAAILANTAASVLQDHFEKAQLEHLETQVAAAEQEDVVADKRKLLSQIIRTEGIIYQGDAPQEGEISPPDNDGGRHADVKPGEAAFVNAKDDFEKAQRSLETLKIKIITHRHFTIGHIRWAKPAGK